MTRRVRFKTIRRSAKSGRRRTRRSLSGGTRKDRSKPKCSPDTQDPFSLELFADIPKNRHIRLLDSGHYHCFDIKGLWPWVSEHGPINPINRNKFSDEAMAKIRRKWRKYERDLEDDPKTPFADKSNKLHFSYGSSVPMYF